MRGIKDHNHYAKLLADSGLSTHHNYIIVFEEIELRGDNRTNKQIHNSLIASGYKITERAVANIVRVLKQNRLV